ncbi:hypothetical protein BS50DRAFT_54350 [Corynespora cassiicola Philippines]|uniref:Uncharacterized protein n=1 Tax=Corynespora cassiicola Philippines TaxID=1448308 RepID=A0A2T2NIT3_CORCC|nr:hypothetical protein BS50DRAFT_54350 [Corynespora cassiicola Philippines]
MTHTHINIPATIMKQGGRLRHKLHCFSPTRLNFCSRLSRSFHNVIVTKLLEELTLNGQE